MFCDIDEIFFFFRGGRGMRMKDIIISCVRVRENKGKKIFKNKLKKKKSYFYDFGEIKGEPFNEFELLHLKLLCLHNDDLFIELVFSTPTSTDGSGKKLHLNKILIFCKTLTSQITTIN